jgi:hypothetical protein
VEHFVTLERAIACPQATVNSAAETAAHVLGQAGYRRGLGFGPTASYVRSHRPTWAVIVAILGALPTVGLSLFLFFYRTKDHCNVVIEDGQYGVVALVSGRIPVSLPGQLEASVGQQHPAPAQAQGQSPRMPPPMVLSPSGSHQHQPAFSPQAILRPATPVPPLPVAGSPFPPAGSPFPAPGAVPNASPQSGPSASPNGHQSPSAPAAPSWAQQPQPPSWVEVPASQGSGESEPRHPRPGPHQPEQPERSPEHRPDPIDQQHIDQQPIDPSAAAEAQPDQAAMPAPVAFRPPSRLAPHAPPGQNLSGVHGTGGPAANGSDVNGDVLNGSNPPAAVDDDPFAATSGRVPWAVSGTRQPAPPSPPAPFPVPASAPAPAPPAPASSQAGGAAALSRPQPGAVATAVGRPAPVLRVDSGQTLTVGPYCLLGREPASRDGDPAATLVKLDDPKLSVSKTHLAYGVDEQGLWVMDRNSTNGTTVINPAGQRIPCAAGVRHYVPVGSQVQIGQRRLTVEAADGAAAQG